MALKLSANLYQDARKQLLAAYRERPQFPTLGDFTPTNVDTDAAASLTAVKGMKSADLAAAEASQAQMAASLSKGQLPEGVAAMIRQKTLESGASLGLSGAQTSRLTARDLGVSSLQMIQAGTEITKQLEGIRMAEVGVAYDSALSKANQTYEAYALKTQQALAKYTADSAAYNNLQSGLLGLTTAEASTQATLTAANLGYRASMSTLAREARDSGRTQTRSQAATVLGGGKTPAGFTVSAAAWKRRKRAAAPANPLIY